MTLLPTIIMGRLPLDFSSLFGDGAEAGPPGFGKVEVDLSGSVVKSVEEMASEMAKVQLEAGGVFNGEDAAEAVDFARVILCEGIKQDGEFVVACFGG